jgi:hypothetical protein
MRLHNFLALGRTPRYDERHQMKGKEQKIVIEICTNPKPQEQRRTRPVAIDCPS